MAAWSTRLGGCAIRSAGRRWAGDRDAGRAAAPAGGRCGGGRRRWFGRGGRQGRDGVGVHDGSVGCPVRRVDVGPVRPGVEEVRGVGVPVWGIGTVNRPAR